VGRHADDGRREGPRAGEGGRGSGAGERGAAVGAGADAGVRVGDAATQQGERVVAVGEEEGELPGVGVADAEPAEPVQRRVGQAGHGKHRWQQQGRHDACGEAQEEKVLHKLIISHLTIMFI